MSLLLDALQRASKEKEKTAQASTSAAPLAAQKPDPARPETLALEPVAPTLQTPAPSATTTGLLMTPPPAVQPEPASPEGAAPPLATPANEAKPIPPQPEPAPRHHVPSEEKPEPAIHRTPAPPSPRIAREILGASASRAQAPRRKRLFLFVAIAVVLALALGALFVVPALNPPTSILPPPAQTPPAAPEPTESTDAAPAAPLPPANDPSPPVSAAAPPTAELPLSPARARPATTSPDAPANQPAPPPPVTAPVEATPSQARSTPTPGTARPVITARPGSNSATLDAAYTALNEGRLDAAAEAYRRALRTNPEEGDALLGLAHIAHRQGQREEASAYYQRLLRQNPDHPVAQAGLLALSESDPELTLGRARDMAERFPESAATQAALGNILARDGQLAEAQSAFFKAMSLEPANPIHAYNLAVALDRLHKPDLARSYYERALALADQSSPGLRQSFPRQAALHRLTQLSPQQQTAPALTRKKAEE